MASAKPKQYAVSYLYYGDSTVAEGASSQEHRPFLIVQRPANDANLPNAWGLPAGMCTPSSGAAGAEPTDEDWCSAVVLSGHQKLGVALEVGALVGEGELERNDYVLHMRQYEVTLDAAKNAAGAAPIVPQPVAGVTQYQQWRWGAPEELKLAASKGSLCSQLYLRRVGLGYAE